MGCCASRPNGSDDQPPATIERSSAEQPDSQIAAGPRAVAHENAEVSQASTSSLLQSARTQASRQRLVAAGRLSRLPHGAKPVKGKALKGPPETAQIEAPLVSLPDGEPAPASSMSLLLKARTEFFDTRVTGTPEMWDAIRMTCGLVEEGALEDARAILEASGGSCPTGILWGKRGGCFDERGERYVVPAWCVGRPPGIKAGSDPTSSMPHSTEKLNVDTGDLVDSAASSYNVEPKGKGKMMGDTFTVKGQELRIRIRYSHTARDDTFTVGDENSLETLAQMAKDKASISYETKVRFVHLGRLLDHKRSLSDINWQKDQILSLFVFAEDAPQ